MACLADETIEEILDAFFVPAGFLGTSLEYLVLASKLDWNGRTTTSVGERLPGALNIGLGQNLEKDFLVRLIDMAERRSGGGGITFHRLRVLNGMCRRFYTINYSDGTWCFGD